MSDLTKELTTAVAKLKEHQERHTLTLKGLSRSSGNFHNHSAAVQDGILVATAKDTVRGIFVRLPDPTKKEWLPKLEAVGVTIDV